MLSLLTILAWRLLYTSYAVIVALMVRRSGTWPLHTHPMSGRGSEASSEDRSLPTLVCLSS